MRILRRLLGLVLIFFAAILTCIIYFVLVVAKGINYADDKSGYLMQPIIKNFLD